MDNFTVPTDSPPGDTPAMPAGPSVTSLPEADDFERFDDPPPPRPEVEDVADAAVQDASAAWPAEINASEPETWFDSVTAAVAARPLLSIAVAGATGFALALAVDAAVRARRTV